MTQGGSVCLNKNTKRYSSCVEEKKVYKAKVEEIEASHTLGGVGDINRQSSFTFYIGIVCSLFYIWKGNSSNHSNVPPPVYFQQNKKRLGPSKRKVSH